MSGNAGACVCYLFVYLRLSPVGCSPTGSGGASKERMLNRGKAEQQKSTLAIMLRGRLRLPNTEYKDFAPPSEMPAL